jgi:hypothetical protein
MDLRTALLPTRKRMQTKDINQRHESESSI